MSRHHKQCLAIISWQIKKKRFVKCSFVGINPFFFWNKNTFRERKKHETGWWLFYSNNKTASAKHMEACTKKYEEGVLCIIIGTLRVVRYLIFHLSIGFDDKSNLALRVISFRFLRNNMVFMFACTSIPTDIFWEEAPANPSTLYVCELVC